MAKSADYPQVLDEWGCPEKDPVKIEVITRLNGKYPMSRQDLNILYEQRRRAQVRINALEALLEDARAPTEKEEC